MFYERDITLLRMLAVDAGFDIGGERDGNWAKFSSAGNLVTVWLTDIDKATIVSANPARVTSETGPLYGVESWSGLSPAESTASWKCLSRASASNLLRRLAVLGRVLPDQVLHSYNDKINAEIEKVLAQGELERIEEVRKRVGQDLFRAALMDYWKGRCAITGVAMPMFLRASHAKPWKDSNNSERLDVHNGLLLTAHLDIAFDQGFITVEDTGSVLVSKHLPSREREVLGLVAGASVEGLRLGHIPYLSWHREKIWKG